MFSIKHIKYRTSLILLYANKLQPHNYTLLMKDVPAIKINYHDSPKSRIFAFKMWTRLFGWMNTNANM